MHDPKLAHILVNLLSKNKILINMAIPCIWIKDKVHGLLTAALHMGVAKVDLGGGGGLTSMFEERG